MATREEPDRELCIFVHEDGRVCDKKAELHDSSLLKCGVKDHGFVKGRGNCTVCGQRILLGGNWITPNGWDHQHRELKDCLFAAIRRIEALEKLSGKHERELQFNRPLR